VGRGKEGRGDNRPGNTIFNPTIKKHCSFIARGFFYSVGPELEIYEELNDKNIFVFITAHED
jgi:hypothetical protein